MAFEHPAYLTVNGTEAFDSAALRFPVIVKPRFEEASIGIDQESVFKDPVALTKKLDSFRVRFGSLIVEEYIAGREFNISLFGYPETQALPIAEIDFSAFPETLYPIVGYRAKWDKASFEYRHTPRRFPEKLPRELDRKLKATARRCFSLFMLRDYGRIDIRVDPHGRAYVLEVNANPCLSPDAGFAAAFRETGSTYSQLISDITDFTMKRI